MNRTNINELVPGSDIEWLKDNTTIVQIFDNATHKVVFGDDFHVCRYMRDQGTQIDLQKLEDFWRKKFDSFNLKWCDELQSYRMLYTSFRRLYFSFEHMRRNKIAQFNELRNDKEKLLYFNEIAGLNVHGIYFHGKKCIDILKKLQYRYNTRMMFF